MDIDATGQKGEITARIFLENNGYIILDTNVNYPGVGELDIVAKDGNTLVFVEVRTRFDAAYGHPFETITAAKKRKIVMASRRYISQKKVYAESYRYDVVSVFRDTPELIKDAFYAYWH